MSPSPICKEKKWPWARPELTQRDPTGLQTSIVLSILNWNMSILCMLVWFSACSHFPAWGEVSSDGIVEYSKGWFMQCIKMRLWRNGTTQALVTLMEKKTFNLIVQVSVYVNNAKTITAVKSNLLYANMPSEWQLMTLSLFICMCLNHTSEM